MRTISHLKGKTMNFVTKTILAKLVVGLTTAVISTALTKAVDDAFLSDDTSKDSSEKSN